MATYKVIQDVEAEDKLVGPLTFKQFIFALIAVFFGYLTFVFFQVHPALISLPLPFALFFGFLAVFRREDQPVEIYLAALLRFWLLPRKKTWSQDGIVELVNITAPKKEKINPNSLSKSEARSKLKNLALVMDTHGWSTKNVMQLSSSNDEDRLIAINELPQIPQPVGMVVSDDVTDIESTQAASNMSSLINESAAKSRQQIEQQLSGKNPMSVRPNSLPQAQSYPTQEETSPLFSPYPKMQQKVVSPYADRQNIKKEKKVSSIATSTMTEKAATDILDSLAHRDDLTVSTVAHEAEHILKGDGEIPLR
ncbi:PrgI family protein [Candidatus Saccharibacteria bacterium CPR2]|nr:PrgI family protein [Candidatus Saccharibacteria bacterium CPR2]